MTLPEVADRNTGARATEPALRVCNVSVRLGGARVLRDVTVEIPAGTWLGVVGPNGAGKTTLLRAAAALCPVESGRIELLGENVADMTPRHRALGAAYVPQDPLIPPGISVRDYVLLGRNPHIGFFAVESARDHDAVSQVLARLELEHFRERPIETLSGGERRRVVLARSLAQEAPVLLLDEPTNGLDLGHAQEVLELIDQLRADRGITVVSAIHDLTLASQYAPSLVMLSGGEVVARGGAAEVLTESRLAEHYNARVRIEPAPHGSAGVIVSPARVGGRP